MNGSLSSSLVGSMSNHTMNTRSTFDGSGDKNSNNSGSIQGNQIMSMFNSLQCQLMTLQSTMVSLQMNQNAIQSSVDDVGKKVTKINSKVSSILSQIGVDNTQTVSNLMESVTETDITDADSYQRKEKKKRKKDRTEKLEKSNGDTSAKKHRYNNAPNSDQNGQTFCASDFHIVEPNDQNSVVHNFEKVSKKNKSKKCVSVDQTNAEVCLIPDNSVPVMEDNELQTVERPKKKRKRYRKKKKSPEIMAPITPPIAPPKEVKMNLPKGQRPNNMKVTFDSDSENESAQVSTAFRVISPEISTKPSPKVIKPEPHTPVVKSEPKAWGSAYSNKNTRRRMRGLQVGELLKQIRCEVNEHQDMYVNMDDSSVTVTKDGTSGVRTVAFSSPEDTCTPMNNSEQAASKTNEENYENEIFEAISVEIQNYNAFPDLHGPPRIGDKIAYKILELSETYSPEISAYKEAGVVSYDNNTGNISLHLIGPIRKKTEPGKFDIIEQTDETGEIVVTNEDYNVELNVKELIEPKLIN